MEVSRKVMRRAAELLDSGRSFALCTVVAARGSVPGKVGAKMIVHSEGNQLVQYGTVGGAGLEEKTKALALRSLAERRTLSGKFDLAYNRPGALDSLCGGTVEILVEYMGAVPHILICGGGHVGLEVARMCGQLEYIHSVLDDRPEFASRERFPSAHGLFVAHPDYFFPQQDLSIYSHVLLLGYSYKIDLEALFHCATRFAGHIGLMASRLKRKEMFSRLRARGVTEAQLARIEAPLGLAIGAESPAEIAISIFGSIIRQHKGASVAEAIHGSEDSEVEDQTGQAGDEQDGEQTAAKLVPLRAPG
jgi:xanthine dehydrogenase accessory factor